MRIAAIDLGSNSFHMLVANVTGHSFETLLRERMTIQIGKSALLSRRLDEKSIQRAMRCIHEFRHLALGRRVDRIVAVATSAVREAENGEDFIHQIRSTTGIGVRAISGREEARLIYLAVRRNIDFQNKKVLLIDLGGGSLEMTVADSSRIYFCSSQKVGFLRLHGQFASADPITESDCQSLNVHLKSVLSDPLAAVRKHKPEMIIATSGMATTLLRIVQRQQPGFDKTMTVSRGQMAFILESSLKLNSLQRAGKLDMDLSRSEYFPTALLCLNAILDGVNIREFVVSPYSLREGLVYDFIAQDGFEKRKRGSTSSHELREGPALDLALKCGYPREHSEKVAQLAGQIFEQTKSLHLLGETERKLLRNASILHDIGYHIAYEKHHKHGAYLVMNGELRGFAPQEREMLAQLVRYHRGAKPKKSHPQFAALPKECRKKLKLLSAILRIADSLDRSHSQIIEEVRCSLAKNTVQFQLFTAGASADVDLILQSTRRKSRFFEKVFGCSTLFHAVKSRSEEKEIQPRGDGSIQNREEIAQVPINAPALKLTIPRQAPAKTSVG